MSNEHAIEESPMGEGIGEVGIAVKDGVVSSLKGHQ